MEPFGWALLVKPFALFLFFCGVYVVARLVFPLIPNGRWKALLYDRSLQRRHPWKFGLGLLFGAYAAMGAAYLAVTYLR